VESFTLTDDRTQQRLARVTGGLYLGFIVASVLGDALAHVGRGTDQQIYRVIVTDVWRFRLGLVITLPSALLFLVTAWGLYALLRRVNQVVALLFVVLNATGVAIQCASMFPLVSAMLQGDRASRLHEFSGSQLQGLAYLSINVYKTGFVTAQLFFATWLLPLGYLVYKSRSLPSFLGILLVLDGVGVLIWFTQVLLYPTHPAIRYPGIVVSFIAELGLALWLLVKGVRVPESERGSAVSRDPSHEIVG